MNITPIPANQIGQRLGVKAIVYGPPGIGKTPVIQTAPNPVLMATEPGLLSIRHTTIPVWQADDYAKIKGFYDWIISSKEARRYQTFCIDSVSHMAELILKEALKQNRDGRKAYGVMSERVMEILDGLYFLSGPNVVLLAKQDDKPEDGSTQVRPFFPGKDLNVKVPHLYDLVTHMENHMLQTGQMVKAFRTRESSLARARDRSGNLDELEPADFTHVFNKMLAKG